MLQAARDELIAALINLIDAVEKFNKNLADTKNKNWAKNVESCRLKVKAALEIAIAKRIKLKGALNQFLQDSLKKAKMDKDGVIGLDSASQRRVENIEKLIEEAGEVFEEANQITTVF